MIRLESSRNVSCGPVNIPNIGEVNISVSCIQWLFQEPKLEVPITDTALVRVV